MGYNRPDLAVKVTLTQQKGYTMKDISSLDKRISNLEYYTVLNALSLDTSTTSVRDSSGYFERFKNGIFADPFNDCSLARTNDFESKWANDSKLSIMRPYYEENLIINEYLSSSSSNIKIAGRLAMLDFDNEKIVCNPSATTYRNCTESYYKWNGNLKIFPSFDNTNTQDNAAPQNVTLNLASSFQAVAGVGGFKDISTTYSAPKQTGQSTRGLTQTNYFSQQVTTTVTDISVGSSATTKDVGNYVTNVATLPYISPRQIAVVTTGLRPNTTFYPFFDGVNVGEYCAPATVASAYQLADGSGRLDTTKITNINATNANDILVQNNSLGSTIKSDSYGNVYLVFNIPASTFRSGDRTFTLVNVDDLNATSAITSLASGVFSSSSLAVTTQQLSFTTIEPTFSPSSTTSVSSQTWTDTVNFPPPPPPPVIPHDNGPDPVGETFYVDDLTAQGIPGIYLTQLGVYFQSKSDLLGITCVVTTLNNGLPDRNKILGSSYLHSSQVSISSDSTTETVFTFETPILLQSGINYAFYLIPEGSNPDYNIWISNVGDKDMVTGNYISSQPYPGVLVASSNGSTWNTYQSQDIKFNLYRAKFKTNTGTVGFRNPKEDYLTLTNINRITSGVPISIGDIVYACNSTNMSQILSTNNAIYPFGVVKNIDELTGTCTLTKTNGLFTNNSSSSPNYSFINFYRSPNPSNTAYISPSYQIANAHISSINDVAYHSIVPKFNLLSPVGTSISTAFYGTSNSAYGFVKDSVATITPNESLYDFNDFERIVRSYSNEVATAGSNYPGTSTFVITLNSGNKYISPTVDIGVKTFNYIKNIINNDDTNEYTRYGNASTKYISKIITLNSTAEDIIVYITAYKPPGASIEVYGKFFLSGGDSSLFDNKLWTRLPYKSGSQPQSGYSTAAVMPDSSPSDPTNYMEYSFGLPTSAGQTVGYATTAYADMTYAPAIGTLTYFDENGGIQRGYNSFAIKIVLLSNNPVIIPNCKDVRALALQV